MKEWQYFTILLLGIVCLGLTVASVITARAAQRLQQDLQAQQVAYNNSVMGERGQQISQTILQDMATAAAKNVKIRKLLERYGYRVQAAETSETSAPPPRPSASGEESRAGAGNRAATEAGAAQPEE